MNNQENAGNASQITSELSIRISQLETLSSDSLKGEMQQLKKTIMENPAACLLLKEEDIGMLVSSLRRITGQAIISSAKAKRPTTTSDKAKKLTAAELQSALEDEDF